MCVYVDYELMNECVCLRKGEGQRYVEYIYFDFHMFIFTVLKRHYFVDKGAAFSCVANKYVCVKRIICS